MRGKKYNRKELLEAAGEVGAGLLALQPEGTVLRPAADVFSARSRRRAPRQLKAVRAAAAVLAILFLAAVALTVPRVRAGVAGWAKETWGTESVLYRFFGQSEEPAARGLVLQFGYLPEGLTEVRRTEGDSQQLYAFKNADGSRLMYLTVMTLAEGRQLQILADGLTAAEYRVNGLTVTDYAAGETDHTLVWFDESRGLAFTMDCLLTLDDALHVVEALEY